MNLRKKQHRKALKEVQEVSQEMVLAHQLDEFDELLEQVKIQSIKMHQTEVTYRELMNFFSVPMGMFFLTRMIANLDEPGEVTKNTSNLSQIQTWLDTGLGATFSFLATSLVSLFIQIKVSDITRNFILEEEIKNKKIERINEKSTFDEAKDVLDHLRKLTSTQAQETAEDNEFKATVLITALMFVIAFYGLMTLPSQFESQNHATDKTSYYGQLFLLIGTPVFYLLYRLYHQYQLSIFNHNFKTLEQELKQSTEEIRLHNIEVHKGTSFDNSYFVIPLKKNYSNLNAFEIIDSVKSVLKRHNFKILFIDDENNRLGVMVDDTLQVANQLASFASTKDDIKNTLEELSTEIEICDLMKSWSEKMKATTYSVDQIRFIRNENQKQNLSTNTIFTFSDKEQATRWHNYFEYVIGWQEKNKEKENDPCVNYIIEQKNNVITLVTQNKGLAEIENLGKNIGATNRRDQSRKEHTLATSHFSLYKTPADNKNDNNRPETTPEAKEKEKEEKVKTRGVARPPVSDKEKEKDVEKIVDNKKPVSYPLSASFWTMGGHHFAELHLQPEDFPDIKTYNAAISQLQGGNVVERKHNQQGMVVKRGKEDKCKLKLLGKKGKGKIRITGYRDISENGDVIYKLNKIEDTHKKYKQRRFL